VSDVTAATTHRRLMSLKLKLDVKLAVMFRLVKVIPTLFFMVLVKPTVIVLFIAIVIVRFYREK